jgi:release factor glutamine methyltransferase
MPIAYLTEQREFWGLNLRVTPQTLIPRPETEHLVEAVLALVPKQAKWRIADLGTGSGAIALAIASERPHCEVIATDTSKEALDVATDNARILGLNNVQCIESHWFTALDGQSFTVICSNPPYIEPNDPHLSEGDLRFEPPSALSAAEQGLADLREIIQQAPDHLQDDAWLLVEHGYQQGPAVLNLFSEAGFTAVETRQDHAGHERVSMGKLPPNTIYNE